MKKIAVGLALILLLSLLSACGDKEEASEIEGMLISLSDTELEISSDSERNYIFQLAEADLSGAKEAAPGDTVKVAYLGQLDKAVTEQPVEVKSVVLVQTDDSSSDLDKQENNDNENTASEGNEAGNQTTGENGPGSTGDLPQQDNNSSPGESLKADATIAGKVVAITVETITLETSQGTYIFNVENAGVLGSDFSIGDELTVGYVGELNPTDETAAASVSKN